MKDRKITQLDKQSEEAIERRNKKWSEIEVKAPNAKILSYIGILKQRPLNAVEAHDFVVALELNKRK